MGFDIGIHYTGFWEVFNGGAPMLAASKRL